MNSNEYQFITLDAVPGGKDSSHRLLPEHNPNILPRRKKRDEIWPKACINKFEAYSGMLTSKKLAFMKKHLIICIQPTIIFQS